MQPREPIRFSHLKSFGTLSPAHYRYGSDFVGTPATERGTAVHALALGSRRVVAYPGKQRRGAEWESFQAAHPDCEILTTTGYETAQAMAAALHAHPLAHRAIAESKHVERTLFWDYAGLPCRSTPDGFNAHRIIDIKTSRTSKPEWFSKIALGSAYHAQLMYYREAIRTLGLGDPQELLLLVVEAAPPHVVTVFRLSDRCMEVADRLWRGWMEQLRVSLDNDSWPGYSDVVVELDAAPEMPTFGFAEDEEAHADAA